MRKLGWGRTPGRLGWMLADFVPAVYPRRLLVLKRGERLAVRLTRLEAVLLAARRMQEVRQAGAGIAARLEPEAYPLAWLLVELASQEAATALGTALAAYDGE